MASPNEFAPTYLALLAMLWAELEDLLAAIDSTDTAANQWPVQARAEAMLLETDLLRECCDKDSVRAALTGEQQLRLRALLYEMRDILDLQPTQLPNPAARSAIVRAQNRVFDEVHALADHIQHTEDGNVSDEDVDTYLEYVHAPNSHSGYAPTATELG